jgi:hypothetical protein
VLDLETRERAGLDRPAFDRHFRGKYDWPSSRS